MSEKTLAKMVVKLEAEVGRLHSELDRSNKKLEKFSDKAKNSLSGVKVAFAGLGVAAGLLTKKVLDASIKQEAAVTQLQATWKSTGGAVGLTVDQMVKDAERLQGISIFGDEEIIKAQSQLATFTNITGETFKATTQAALDLSVKMDQDLKSSVVQLGKALNDPIKNLSALSRTGIQFSDAQKDLITELVETNRLGEAQGVILEELNKQFGGSAAAARDTFGGALKGLNNAFGDLFEADSMAGAIDGLNELTALLSDPQTKEAASSLANAIISLFNGAARAITNTVNVVRFLGEELAAAIHGPEWDDVVRRTELIADLTEEIAINTERAKRSGHLGKNARERLPELQAELEKQKEIQRQYEASLVAKEQLLHTDVAPVKLKIGEDKKKDGAAAAVDSVLPDYDDYGLGAGEDAFDSEEDKRLDAIAKIREGWRRREEQAELEHQARILDFQEASTKDKIKTVLSEGVALTQGAAHTSKKLFKLNQALALADAAVTLPSAVMKAYERGDGLPWGAAFAAMTLANGLARIREIKNARFGGGSTAPSLAGTGGGAIPVTNVDSNISDVSQVTQTNQQQTPVATYIFNGDIFTEGAKEKIIDLLIEANDSQRIRAVDRNGEIIFER